MIDLYAAPTSNGMRARIALEECGLPYKLHAVDIPKGENRTAAFLAMNPNGQIPVIVDHEGPGGIRVTLSQSTAILLYCAEKAGKFMPQDPAARPAVLRAVMSGSTDVTPLFGAYFLAKNMKEPHAPTVQMFQDRLRSLFQVWDAALAGSRYCAGDEVTIADFSLFAGYARIRGAVPDIVAGLPNLARWAEAMDARPAIKRALKFYPRRQAGNGKIGTDPIFLEKWGLSLFF
jgi:GST-like protein